MTEPCCPSCDLSDATDALKKAVARVEAAHNWAVELGTEADMAHAYLRDEVEQVARSPFAFLVRRRLLKALEVSR